MKDFEQLKADLEVTDDVEGVIRRYRAVLPPKFEVRYKFGQFFGSAVLIYLEV